MTAFISRRNVDQCKLCFFPAIVIAGEPTSFGLSINTANSNTMGEHDGNCATDFIVIPGGVTEANTNALTSSSLERFCGRAFNAAADNMGTGSVCSKDPLKR